MSIFSWLRLPRRQRTFGEAGEIAACKFLKRQGYRVVSSRHRNRWGEIDVIAVQGQTLVFVEVKSRRKVGTSRPAEAVDATRQSRLTRAALAFLKAHSLLEYPSRFDIIEVIWPLEAPKPTICHLQNAFSPVGRGQFYH